MKIQNNGKEGVEEILCYVFIVNQGKCPGIISSCSFLSNVPFLDNLMFSFLKMV